MSEKSRINLYRATRALGTVRAAEVRLMFEAIESHKGCAPESCGGTSYDPCNLAAAITHLTTVACDECNYGGHTCPGDGNPIPHSAANCGEHEDDVSAGMQIEREQVEQEELAAVEQAEQQLVNEHKLIWVPRTWVDVRKGDTVRMPGSGAAPAYVVDAKHQRWHVDPRTGTSSFNPPKPLEWECVHVTLADRADETLRRPLGEWDMDPVKPIEIQMTQLEVDAIELMGGWSQRVGLQWYTDVQNS